MPDPLASPSAYEAFIYALPVRFCNSTGSQPWSGSHRDRCLAE